MALLPPTNKLPPTPTPPDTNKAPVDVLVETVVLETTTDDEAFTLVALID
jgi:hypothetical protein